MRRPTVSSSRAPSRPTSPSPQKHNHAEHLVHPDSAILDIDGPSRSEVDEYGDGIFAVVIAVDYCQREGCEKEHRRRFLYDMGDVSDDTLRAIEDAKYEKGSVTEYAAMNTTVVDWDGHEPYVGIEIDGSERGYISPCECIEVCDELRGECYGTPLEPSYEPGGL